MDTHADDLPAVASSPPTPQVAPEVPERVAVSGDLSGLSAAQRLAYYQAVCQSLGLNPLTKPFEYLTLNGTLRLYALRDCADQLRRLRGTRSPSPAGSGWGTSTSSPPGPGIARAARTRVSAPWRWAP